MAEYFLRGDDGSTFHDPEDLGMVTDVIDTYDSETVPQLVVNPGDRRQLR